MMFRGASADAVADLTDDLGSTAQGDPRRAATMAAELFEVSATLRREGSLRRFATDASVPAETRGAMVRDVFGGQVDEHTVELLADAVSRRWTHASDLADGVEQLGVVAAVRSAGDDSERLSDELFAVTQAVRTNPDLRDALSDPARTVEDKEALVRGLLGDKTLEATTILVVQALAGTHRTVVAALTEFQQVAAAVHGENIATVRVPRDLTDEEERRLAQALSQQYGRQVHLNLVVDPAVLGGVRVEIGDDVIDGTVSSRLAEARRRLTGSAG